MIGCGHVSQCWPSSQLLGRADVNISGVSDAILGRANGSITEFVSSRPSPPLLIEKEIAI